MASKEEETRLEVVKLIMEDFNHDIKEAVQAWIDKNKGLPFHMLADAVTNGLMNAQCNSVRWAEDRADVPLDPKEVVALFCWQYRNTLKSHLGQGENFILALTEGLREKIMTLETAYETVITRLEN